MKRQHRRLQLWLRVTKKNAWYLSQETHISQYSNYLVHKQMASIQNANALTNDEG